MQDLNNINDLIAGCCKKERSSQEALYRNFFGYGLSICLRYAQNREEAVEILNDGFLKIFNHIQSFDTSRSFKTWLGKIMVNTSIDFLRSKKRLIFMDDISQVAEPTTDETSVDKLSYDELLRHVQALPPAYKTVFNLYVMEGFQHQEIAAMLGISEGTSKSNLFKAKKILKERITKSSMNIADGIDINMH
ncbi:sigma-70 family RNA polymerase sigma factor [Chitinophaga polysaccharea]|uniref:RNA polymerase sigma factor n=1 Tax=Chitinophaga TaxID=79328 RepID=UPI0014554CFB|nr:sigma-70 family RNA polymerase sigma factor [Chitinophaga sp. Ak27]NLR59838.1 sigma-70 family RNA polymerase sigma factor [Chitinophaga polysaccharea]NLU96415.1 sigma-70 family RNA polymerase sigma factor [Chitinophaga sp. Ak27]